MKNPHYGTISFISFLLAIIILPFWIQGLCVEIAVIDFDRDHGSDIWYEIKKESPEADVRLVIVDPCQNGLNTGIRWAIDNDVDVIAIPLVTLDWNPDVADSIYLANRRKIKVIAPLWNKDLAKDAFIYRLKKEFGIDMSKVYPAHYPGVIQASGDRRGNSFAAAKLAARLDEGL